MVRDSAVCQAINALLAQTLSAQIFRGTRHPPKQTKGTLPRNVTTFIRSTAAYPNAGFVTLHNAIPIAPKCPDCMAIAAIVATRRRKAQCRQAY
jgi:hypothetical protein